MGVVRGRAEERPPAAQQSAHYALNLQDENVAESPAARYPACRTLSLQPGTLLLRRRSVATFNQPLLTHY